MVVIQKPDKWTLVRIEKSTKKEKKYMGILKNKMTRKLKNVHFGSAQHEHFFDSTGLGLWSHKNHTDMMRRKKYFQRFGNHAPMFSSKWFSHKFLWE